MNNKDATFLLEACRSNGADSADPEFAEALAQAGADPLLKTWFDDQRRFDSAVAARLQSIAAPADLRSRILAGGRVSRPQPWFRGRRLWAIAAMVTIFSTLGLWSTTSRLQRQAQWQDRALATLAQLTTSQMEFDAKSNNVADLQQWLRKGGAPVASTIPASLQRLASIGCKTVSWDGRPISIICFHGPGGDLVHLAMMKRSGMPDPPGTEPVYGSRDGWRTATWSQGDMAMMLATRAPEAMLHSLLALSLW